MSKRLFGAIILAIFLSAIISGCGKVGTASGHSLTQEAAVIKIVKTPYLLNVSKVFLPQVRGMTNLDLQDTINSNLKATILSFANPSANSSLYGDVEVSFYNSNLLGLHFRGNSFTPGAARPNKIDCGIHIDLTTGKVYKIEDLFKSNVDFESKIKEICSAYDSSYRIKIESLWDGWTNKTFSDSWVGNEKSFLLLENSMRVYSIPSYAQGAISGYNVPYAKMSNFINLDGELWKKMQSQKPKAIEVIGEDVGAGNAALYRVGHGRVGLLSRDLTINDAKRIITDTYQGRIIEKEEPAGEGTISRVVNVYLDSADDNHPALKIILDDKGKIYQIMAFSSEFKTAKGLHAGSSWAEIQKLYPNGKMRFEGVVAFFTPDDRVICSFDPKSKMNWEKINLGQENPPDDLKIMYLFTM
ncbi:hypothetical protein [Pelosinus sp. sgz500959]|uniref:hypothetical protein n=1 Tax=Pelosinus sp. sgz500959 TaxID=3242472 RepID=UPI0036730C6A